MGHTSCVPYSFDIFSIDELTPPVGIFIYVIYVYYISYLIIFIQLYLYIYTHCVCVVRFPPFRGGLFRLEGGQAGWFCFVFERRHV